VYTSAKCRVHTGSRMHIALLKDKQTYLRCLCFSGMCSGVGKLINDVSGQHIGPIVKVQTFKFFFEFMILWERT